VLIDDKDSLHRVPPGRVDVYLKRSDGHSISDAIDINKLEEKIYFVRDVASKKMGIDFVNQLMEHPNECTPELDGDIMNYLAIYAKLHPDAEIYIAVPEAGNPNRVMLWRWDRPSGTLQKVLDTTGGYPIRFAFLTGTGMAFSSVTVAEPKPPDPSACGVGAECPPGELQPPTLNPSGVPFDFQLRGHYGRLLVLTGLEWQLNLTGTETPEGKRWAESYQTQDNALDRTSCTMVQPEEGPAVEVCTEPVRYRRVNLNQYFGVGVVLSKDAAVGFGPRGYFQFGKVNSPNAWDMSLHLGMTTKGPLDNNARIKSLIDVDGYFGLWVPHGQTLYRKTNEDGELKAQIMPNFGIVASAGTTF
jgi:hypothetical protein